MTSMNDIINLSSDEDDDKVVEHTNSFEGFSDEKPKRIGLRKSNSPDLTVEEEDNDDCVVLDCDPYKTTEKESTFDSDEEILVVGQKGEIACRDFPHPRHACAKYPFKSTSHDKYCDMCHCYVCDIPAPCPQWCFGVSSINHCHANDKEQLWKDQREYIRAGKVLPPQSVLSLQNSWYPLVNQFGIRTCSASTVVASRPNTYIRTGYRPGYRPERPNTYIRTGYRPGYRSELSITFSQNPDLQPRVPHNGNPRPQVLSSKSFTWTQRPSGGANFVENGVHNVAQGSQYTGYAPPPTALQGNSQRSVSGCVSTVPSSHTNMYGRQFSRNTRSGNAQTSAVSSQILYPPVKQQQQQQQAGRSNNKVLSEIEDWLMDSTTPTDPVCPLSGLDSTTFLFDFEKFFE